MRKPKILIGLTYYLPNISGVTQYAVILAEELVKRKYEIEVVGGKQIKNLPNMEILNGVKVFRIGGISLGKGFIMPTYPIESIKRVRHCDVINCHLPSIESFWLALWAKIFHKRLIITHHCEFQLNGNFNNFLTGLLTYPIHLVVYWWADKIVAYTQDYAKTSIFLRFFKKKIIYVLPPIKIQSTPDPSFDKEGKYKGYKIVGFVGRIGWEKGLEYLISAMKNIKAKLILVGPYKDVVGDNTYKNLKRNKNVEFIGPVDHDMLNKYYEKFDCLVLPSTNNLETFGMVQAEAMVCGTPVVASNLPGVRVPVQITGMGEICNVADSADLAEKINIVLNNGKNFYQKIAKNLDQFDYKRTVDEYEKIFNNR